MLLRNKKKSPKSSRNFNQRPNVFSYYTNRADTEEGGRDSTRGRTPAWRQHLHHLPTWLALIAIILSVIYALSIDPNPRVVLSKTGADQPLLRSPSSYQDSARQILKRSPLSYSKLTINSAGFVKTMQAQFPELAHVTITLPIMARRPVVNLEAAQPTLYLKTSQGNFVVDARGRAIIKEDDIPAGQRPLLPRLTDDSNPELGAGQQVLRNEHVAFMQTMAAQVAARTLVVETMTLPLIANELHVRFKDLPYFVKFDLGGDPSLQAGTFLAAKAKLDTDKVTPAEYIDVRVEERAYYK